jgi:hypothetical protein
LSTPKAAAIRPEDLVALLIPLTFLAVLAVETLGHTGRPWPAMHWWRAKGFAFFLVLMTINAVPPSLVPPKVAAHHLVDGSRLGLAGGSWLATCWSRWSTPVSTGRTTDTRSCGAGFTTPRSAWT